MVDVPVDLGGLGAPAAASAQELNDHPIGHALGQLVVDLGQPGRQAQRTGGVIRLGMYFATDDDIDGGVSLPLRQLLLASADPVESHGDLPHGICTLAAVQPWIPGVPGPAELTTAHGRVSYS